jgi:cell division protein FtsW (lipid II flippase)
VSAGGTSLVSLMLMQGIVQSIRMRQKTGLNLGTEK